MEILGQQVDHYRHSAESLPGQPARDDVPDLYEKVEEALQNNAESVEGSSKAAGRFFFR